MTTPRPPLSGEGALDGAIDRLIDAVLPRAVVPGWATVDLERAESELVAKVEPDVTRGDATPATTIGSMHHSIGRNATQALQPARDLQLGATARVIPISGAGRIVLLEPSTEGRVAAALARHGEGFVALYLLGDPGAVERAAEAGFVTSRADVGPLGRQRLVRIAPPSGPFVVLVLED